MLTAVPVVEGLDGKQTKETVCMKQIELGKDGK